jgi:predicted acyltransferase
MQEVNSTPSTRLLSIDALRGFDMFWIIGGDELVHALAEWAPSDLMKRIDEQMDHVEWEGFHFYDLIFPLFLFLVGVVLPFSMAAHRAKGESTGWLYWRILRRGLFSQSAFEVAVVKDATAAPRHPEIGDGYKAALINYGFLANAVLTTRTAI